MKNLLVIMVVSALVLLSACGANDNTTDTSDEGTVSETELVQSDEEIDDGLVHVEIEKIDTTAKPTQKVEEKSRDVIKVAVVGAPATDILSVADESISTSKYSIGAVKCENFNQPFEMVAAGDAVACLSSNQVFLDSYNKINESGLVIAERIYIDPLAIFPGKVNDLNSISSGTKIAVSQGDTNVARALYLLEQKGIIEVKEGALYQASVEDIVSNPHNISIEEVDISSKWPDVNQYGLIICDYNRAVLAGNDPESAIGEENRNSKIFDLFTVNLVVRNDMLEDSQTAVIRNAINSEEVESYIKDNFYRAVLDYK